MLILETPSKIYKIANSSVLDSTLSFWFLWFEIHNSYLSHPCLLCKGNNDFHPTQAEECVRDLVGDSRGKFIWDIREVCCRRIHSIKKQKINCLRGLRPVDFRYT